mmetsp:Transcript_92729/g.300005  ORF Transcript_92729/g.300005 Transcript_92729/m.300005 type:complete len:281 (+) Transcript_92729:3730-4572(+)
MATRSASTTAAWPSPSRSGPSENWPRGWATPPRATRRSAAQRPGSCCRRTSRLCPPVRRHPRRLRLRPRRRQRSHRGESSVHPWSPGAAPGRRSEAGVRAPAIGGTQSGAWRGESPPSCCVEWRRPWTTRRRTQTATRTCPRAMPGSPRARAPVRPRPRPGPRREKRKERGRARWRRRPYRSERVRKLWRKCPPWTLWTSWVSARPISNGSSSTLRIRPTRIVASATTNSRMDTGVAVELTTCAWVASRSTRRDESESRGLRQGRELRTLVLQISSVSMA